MRAFLVPAAIALVALAGAAQGLWIGRWAPSDAIGEAAARLDRIPLVVGGWQGRDLEFDRREIEQAQIDGHLMRLYTDARTGAVVSLLVVCGRPGPISVHTPDICYAGVGFVPEADPSRIDVRPAGGPRPAAFWASDFRKEGTTSPTYLRVLWAWNAEGDWESPDHPRLAFARQPALYKLYVVHQMAGPGLPLGEGPAAAFLQELLPTLDDVLSPALGGLARR